MRRFNFGYFISEGFFSIFTHGLMSFAAVCMIVACLLIMGSFSLVAVNVGEMLGSLERENEFLAYVDENLTDSEVTALGTKLRQVNNVSTVTFEEKKAAKESYISKYAGGEDYDIFAQLPEEVFRDRYHIHVVDIKQFSQTAEAVRSIPGVARVRVEGEVADGFVVVRNVATGVAVILIGMLLVIAFFIMSNTIKLAAFTRRDEIAIMKMCGATNSFIRWPFVFEGMLLGLMGAVVAFFLEWGLYVLIGDAIGAADTIRFIEVIPYEDIAWKVLGVFMGTGLVVGIGGSSLSIGKFLRV